MSDIIGQVVDFAKTQYASYGYLIVLIGSYLENTVLMGLIFPGGTLLILGAVFAAQGTLSLPIVILLGWLGMFLGSSTDYWIGRGDLWKIIERTRLRKWLDSGMHEAKEVLDKRGGWAIFLSHFLGQIRTFVALTAGIVHMPYRKFALYELPSALFWNIIFCGAGFLIGGSVSAIEDFFKGLGLVSVAIALVVYFFWKRSRKRHEDEQALQKAKAEETEPDKTKVA